MISISISSVVATVLLVYWGGIRCESTIIGSLLLVGNQAVSKAQVYEILYDKANLQPLPVNQSNLVWSSPEFPSVSEVKRVNYRGDDAILITSGNGVVIVAYPSGQTLFSRQMGGGDMSIHSAEVLPDGNVALACSLTNLVVILTSAPADNTSLPQMIDESVKFPIPFAHGVVWDNQRRKLLVLGYLNVYIFDYSPASYSSEVRLRLEKSVSFESFYLSPNHNETAEYEDGGHDLYPIDGQADLLFLTTGERVHIYNAKTDEISIHESLYQLVSQSGLGSDLVVAHKGGVKVISKDGDLGLTYLHAAPWVSPETNYPASSNHLIWSFENGPCAIPDYDYTSQCKVNFTDLKISFYKARVFKRPSFSFDSLNVDIDRKFRKLSKR